MVAADRCQIARQQTLVDAQLRRLARNVGRLGAARSRELADAVDGIVVVEGEQEAVAGVERIGLADETQRAGRVRREDRDVLVPGGAEELEYRLARLLDELRHRRRRRVERVRVAEDVASQQIEVLGELRLGVEAGTGVVEIDVAARVKAGKLAAAELVECRLRSG